MGLYQRSVLKNYLTSLDDSKVGDAYNEFKTFFFNPVTQQNIRNSKEEQFQGTFLIEVFVKIMGYTFNPNPNFNLISEQKNVNDAKKADGAILIDGKVVGVIELKGTNTIDLGKIQQQAFNYLNAQPEAIYVITSNYEKLRFYIQKSNDYEEFNLFTLSLDEFKLLYLCISLDSIIKGLPLKIKQESLVKEEVITKQLYKDYSGFKNDLFTSLCERNNLIDKLTLFKATQKLIDRFLFIFFCEDNNGLLPANLIRTIVDHWNRNREDDDYKPLYAVFKKYFNYINSGSTRVGNIPEIFAFNGGLFAEDSLLDKLDIDDNILYTHTQKLSTYDFISEVDVNILGHIFEHSLNDIEEIQAELAGEIVDKSKTKRKKDGVFYTPKYITEYIVENTVGKLCADKKAALDIDENLFVTAKSQAKRIPLLEKLNAYKNYLLSITICDPACGSGAFLNQAYVFLQKEHQYVADLESKLFDAPIVISDVSADILENNLFGVDINEESIEIARLALWLRSAKKGRKLNNLSNNIKCGNSLIDDPEVAGDKAFNWEQEFPQVFAKGGFDVVIGNPPYVFGGNNGINNFEKDFFKRIYLTGDGKVNLFTLFIEKSFNILREQGEFSFIIPNTFLRVTSYHESRKYFIDKYLFRELADLGDGVFEGAVTTAIIITSTKAPVNLNESVKIIKDFSGNYHSLEIKDIINNNYLINSNITIGKSTLINKLLNKQTFLGDLCKEMIFGVVISHNRDEVVFNKYEDGYKPFLEGKDIGPYLIKPVQKYLDYQPSKLHRARTKEVFEVPEKILIQRISGGARPLKAAYDDSGYYNKESINNVILHAESEYKTKFILALLNSKLVNWFYNNIFTNESTLTVNISKEYLSRIPIILSDNQELFIKKVEILLSSNLIIYDKSNKFISRIKTNLQIGNITGKIEKFYEHDFKTFLGELKKQKVILTLKDQDEWEDYFNTYKQDINILQADIAKTDMEIDKMVYELYGLTDDEIRVVEGS